MRQYVKVLRVIWKFYSILYREKDDKTKHFKTVSCERWKLIENHYIVTSLEDLNFMMS